jgi:hypothetical protein
MLETNKKDEEPFTQNADIRPPKVGMPYRRFFLQNNNRLSRHAELNFQTAAKINVSSYPAA